LWRRSLPKSIWSFLSLESSGNGGFEDLGLGKRESSGESVRELGRESDLMRERDLNAVGPKTVETGSTGQTGLAKADKKSLV